MPPISIGDQSTGISFLRDISCERGTRRGNEDLETPDRYFFFAYTFLLSNWLLYSAFLLFPRI